MSVINLETLHPSAAKRIRPFFDEVLGSFGEKMHSVYVTGTAITGDFNDDMSDVNSIFVLKEMDLKFLELLAPLGKTYGKKRVAAPLIMTPAYIQASLDVFPIEFLNFKLIHTTVLGEDLLENIEISKLDLRHHCERELKVKLIWLRQGYLDAMGDRKLLTEGFVNSITGYIPLFRGIITLLGKKPSKIQSEVISGLSEAAHINTDVFTQVLKEKNDKIKLSIEELNTMFEDYYEATENIGKIVDEIKI